jgi:protein SCO1
MDRLTGVDPRRPPLLAGLAAALCARGLRPRRKPSFKAIDITGAEYARSCAHRRRRQVRTLADFKGKVTVVFFGFTQCPDVCPTTLAELAQVKQSLGADGARVQGVFVTVDPERDTAEILKAYVGQLRPDFVALRGTLEETQAAAKQFKVFYAKVPGKTEGSYTMDHTAGSYVFDAQGRVRLFTRYGTGAEALVHDLSCCWPGRRRGLSKAPGGLRSGPKTQASSALRIFFIAATSIWRMRSALTPYSAASSCSVMPPLLSSLTFSQRSSTMRRLRASSTCSACADAVAGQPVAVARFQRRVGSLLSSAR